MSISDSKGVFQSGDSQELLNYVNLRLKAGDLSREEALAMMSAVHAELGKGSSADPRIFQLYNTTLRTIQLTMPAVYDFIVATWNQRHEKNLKALGDDTPNIDGDAPMENNPSTVDFEPKEGVYRINTLVDELDKTDEEGSEEVEEKETDEVEEKVVDQEQEEEKKESEDETEERSDEASDKIEEELTEADQEADDAKDESLQEPETEESINDGGEENDTERNTEENNVETDEGSSDEESVNESTGGTEKLENDGEGGENQGEEMEWPELEQSLPEEPIEGLEGGESSPESEE